MTASALEKSQIIVHASASIAYTAYDIRWIPLSPRFVTTGQLPRGTGVLSVYQLQDAKINLVAQIEKPHAFKCATLGHAGLDARRVATGDFGGRLSLWDLDRIDTPVFSVVAHDQIINCIDGCGGTSVGHGPPEIATGSRDGSVKIWDTRQQDPVATMAPKHGDPIVDTWSVAFGNSHNDLERAVCAGYENGDVKMFDLRTMGLLWETNVKNGVLFYNSGVQRRV